MLHALAGVGKNTKNAAEYKGGRPEPTGALDSKWFEDFRQNFDLCNWFMRLLPA